MRAIMLESFESSPALREVPPPQIAPNEVLVRVRASSVNPVDGAIAAGMMSGMVEHEFPVVLGRDYAGVVEQAGPDVTRAMPKARRSTVSCRPPTRPSTMAPGPN